MKSEMITTLLVIGVAVFVAAFMIGRLWFLVAVAALWPLVYLLWYVGPGLGDGWELWAGVLTIGSVILAGTGWSLRWVIDRFRGRLTG